MKKKAIEKIPYLTLPKVSRKKDVKYIGVTAVKNVGHERHFFLEVYRNMKEAKAVPVVRIVLTKKDFGTYRPEDGTWSRTKVNQGYSYSGRCIWEDESCRTWEEREKANALCREEDLERIKKFFADFKIWRDARWWEYIERHQDHIVHTERHEQNHRKQERRQQALNDRIKNTPELPETEILENADKKYFSRKHYLYYKKHGYRVQIACSKCGGVTEARWKDGISYESQFQRRTDEPRNGRTGKCLLCGEIGEWRCQGKAKTAFRKSVHLFLGQKYKETGLVMRYIEAGKEWQLELAAGNDGPEMVSACEELSAVEVARAYFEEGKPVQIDYNKYHPCCGNFWDDCNLYGMSNIRIESAPVMWQTYPEMKGTFLQYSALKEYEEAAGEVNPIEYLERYQHTPQIEMLVKLNLIGVVKELVRCHYGIVVNIDAERPDEFLGIRKERVKQLMEGKGSIGLLNVMQMEKRMKQAWTDEQIRSLKETGLMRGQIEITLRYMSLQQLLNRVEKYAGCEYGTGCTNAEARIRHIAMTYVDYLSMRQDLGYDLNNTVYQQPRDLTAAHEKMVMERNQKELDKRLLEVKEKFPDIRKNYRKLRNRFFYEDEKLLIRPARSAEEIVMEGRILHHCVGGNDYLRKHNKGETYILMVRDQKDPELPYITVEIDAERERIIQWYGDCDKKPDKDNMQKWMDNYITRLRCGALAAGPAAGQPEVQQMLQPAM